VPAHPTGHRFDRRGWYTRRALLAHGALIIWVPGCAVACWWQVGIALSGDSLGWIYSVMWPSFAVFGTVFWWYFVHDDPDTVGRRGLRRAQRAVATDGESRRAAPDDLASPDDRDPALARTEDEDTELAAYNAYLAALAREDRPKSWRGR
jgi:hypothetical protein